ncbi:M16 family metallopeptidase [Negadavirga shengliensis]|uniref:M16 family metallopeptidase n=1 Tax=Negadavirga shengliensis TaxID=1389218 RepID=A0ABV9T4F4_9BACT
MYFIPTPQIEAVKLEIIFPIDYRKLDNGQTLVPFFSLHMALEGTGDMNSEQIDDFFDYHASEVEIHTGYEKHGLELLTTTRHFSQVLPVFRSLLTEAVFPDKELNKRKSQKKLTISLQKEQTGTRANQLIRRALFGNDHPFGYIAEEDEVDRIDRDILNRYYHENFRVTPEIFVTGNLSDADLKEVEGAFGDLPYSGEPIYGNPYQSLPDRRLTEYKPQAVQSSIRLGKTLISKSHPDYHAVTVFNTFLGGYFGSRLIKNIREEKGYTYGIHSFLGSLKSADYLLVLADVKEGHADQVIEEVYKELSVLSQEPLPPDELEIVRNYMIGHLLAQFSSPFDLMTHFKKVHHAGMDFGFYQEQLRYIKNFTLEEMMAIGQQYFRPGTFKEVVVGAK